MKINIVYPTLAKIKKSSYSFVRFIGFLFIVSALVCILLNIILKGKMWSLIACVSMYIVWKYLLSPTLIEYNPIDQFIGALSSICLLLHFIDLFLYRGWGIKVIPIVLFSGLIFISVLLFTNYEKQKHNVFPIYTFCIFTIALSICGICIDYFKPKWVYIVLLSVSCFYVLLCSFVVKNNIFKELKKRLSIK